MGENLVETAKKQRKENGEDFSYLETTADLNKWERSNGKGTALGQVNLTQNEVSKAQIVFSPFRFVRQQPHELRG